MDIEGVVTWGDWFRLFLLCASWYVAFRVGKSFGVAQERLDRIEREEKW